MVPVAAWLKKPERWARRAEAWWLRLRTPRDGLRWTSGASSPEPLLDAGGAQIGDLLYVACGFKSIGAVNEEIFVFNMRTERWVGRIAIPRGLAHSHCAIASDGQRYIYFASGQVGPQCGPAVPNVFSYDTQEDTWHELSAVPAARYAATMQLWRGRLHFVGGADADRWTPKSDHWSLAVSSGRTNEAAWRTEQPIPVAGMHRSSAVVGGHLYVFGGQQGDFVAIPGDPACTCTGRTQERHLSCAFRLSGTSEAWERVADIPIAVSHTDFAAVVVDDRVLLIGGQVYKDPEQFYQRLSDAIQAYDPATDRWSMLAYLPHKLKTPVAGLLGRRLFVATGQRGTLPDGDRPGDITRDLLVTTLPPLREMRPLRAGGGYAGKRILLISHDLSRSGAPLLLLETAQALIDRGATVRLATASDDAKGWNLASQFGVPLIPIESAVAIAAESDVIIANTISSPTANWVRKCLAANPFIARRLVWWVHEIDVEIFREAHDLLQQAALAIFDSEAARSAWQEVVTLPSRVEVLYPPLSDSFVERTSLATVPFPANAKARRQRTVELTRDEIRKRLGVSDREFLLLCIGTFEPRKGQRMLIRTIAKLASESGLPIKLAIVGLQRRSSRAALLRELSPEERHVLSPSRTYVQQQAVACFYRASDAFVMNSQGMANGRGEAFGRVTTEAMAFGLPVLGTSAGGTKEIIEDGVTGYLFPTAEAGQAMLRARVEALVRDKSLALRLGAAGREHALARFQQDTLLGRLAEILDPIW
jgi:glycosyltransferase involved in cell wall biosynthesis